MPQSRHGSDRAAELPQHRGASDRITRRQPRELHFDELDRPESRRGRRGFDRLGVAMAVLRPCAKYARGWFIGA